MKESLKKICVFMLALTLALSVIGCSSEETESAQDTQNAEKTEQDDKSTSADTTASEKKEDAATDNSEKVQEGNTSDTTTVDSQTTDSTVTTTNVAVSGQLNVKADVKDGYTCDNGIYTFTKEGEYQITGKLENGMIVVNAPEAKVELNFADCYMVSEVNSLVYVEDADEVVIKAAEGTTNTFIDNRPYKDSDNEDKEAGNAAIYAKDDLKIKGKGKMVVEGNYKNGIQSKNDIEVKNLTLEITAADNALKGNDSVIIESGVLTLTALGGSGIKTDNDRISNKGNQKGNITILGGNVNITSKKDCLKAALDVIIDKDAGAVVVENQL